MGRVQVRFDWQGGGDNTEWIRVLTPDAGSSGKVSKNRGFVFIPEVSDQVMVGFVHSHPDRPYVMGGLFHGKIGSGGGKGNNVKSLSSKSGHIIQLNDAVGIEIKDRNGNYVTLSGSGDVTTSVSNNSTENIGVTHTINVGSKEGGGANSVLKMDSGGNVSIKSDNEIKLETGGSSVTMSKGGTIVIKGKNVTIEGTENVFIKSKNADIKGSGAAHANFNESTTITGTQVDIN
jgi:uncharacterized protein involved in type VI secretion and phage assembly